MVTTENPLPLLDDEKALLAVWRELPAGPLQRRVKDIVMELVRFARDPHCDEMQSDGVPCGDPRSRCEDCSKVIDILRKFEARVRGPELIPPGSATTDVETEAW